MVNFGKLRLNAVKFVGILLLGLLTGLSINFIQAVVTVKANPAVTSQDRELTPPSSVEYEYIYFPFAELVAKSDTIVAGRVLELSETKWNQDSGEYWEHALEYGGYETIVIADPYYELTISVERSFVNNITDDSSADKQLTITVPEMSPLDSGSTAMFRTGDEIIAFVIKDEMAWYEGTATYDERYNAVEIGGEKSVFTFIGSPSASFLSKGEDGNYTHWDPYFETTTVYTIGELLDTIAELR